VRILLQDLFIFSDNLISENFFSQDLNFSIAPIVRNKDLNIYSDKSIVLDSLKKISRIAISNSYYGSIICGYTINSEQTSDNKVIRFYFECVNSGIDTRKIEIIQKFIDGKEDSNTCCDEVKLSIIKNNIKLLGGKFWTNIQQDNKVLFNIACPLLLNQAKNSNKKSKVPDLSGLTVLIADGERDVLKTLQIILDEAKAEILVAENGLEVLDLCKKRRSIDVAIIDANMPLMSGFVLIKELNEIRPDLKLIAKTVVNKTDDFDRLKSLNCKDIITFPFSKNEIFSIIKKIIAE